MRWQNRDKKIKQRQTHKSMSKPFKRERQKDSSYKKNLSKYFKKLRQAERQVEEDENTQ